MSRASHGASWRHLVGGSADFVCIKARLVVEVDGGVHEGRARLDARRDSILQRAGYRVLGIPAALVTSNLEGAVALIRNALAT